MCLFIDVCIDVHIGHAYLHWYRLVKVCVATLWIDMCIDMFIGMRIDMFIAILIGKYRVGDEFGGADSPWATCDNFVEAVSFLLEQH